MTHATPSHARSAGSPPARSETRCAPSPRAFGAAVLLSAGALLAITSPSFAANPFDDLLGGLEETLQAGSQTTAPLVDDLSQTLEPVIDEIATMGAPASEELATTITPVVAAVSPVLDLAQPVVGGLAPVTGALQPVTASLAPTWQALEPMTGALQPLSQPVLEALAPVTATLAPALDPLGPILDPLGEDEATAPTGEDPPAQPVESAGSATDSAAPESDRPLDARASDMVDTSGSVTADTGAQGVPASVHADKHDVAVKHDVAAPAPDPGWGTDTAAATPLAPAGAWSASFGSIQATMAAAGSSTMLVGALVAGLLLLLRPVWRTWSGASFAMPPGRTLTVPVPPG